MLCEITPASKDLVMPNLKGKVFARYAILCAEVCCSCLCEGTPSLDGHR